MAEPQPFNRTELQSAEKAFATYFKCQSTLNIVRARVNDRFQTNLGAKSGLTRATFERDKNFGYVQCYLAKKFPHAAVRWVGLALSAESDHLDFSVWLWGKRSSLIDSIRRDLVWDDWGDDRGCSSSIRLRGNRSDIPRMVNHAVESSSLLGRAIPRYA